MDINEKIKKIISENEVCLFMKGTAEAPQCGFSMAVTNVLKHLKVNFKDVNVLEDENLRQGIKDFSDWPTIPQLYVKKEFVGGCDIIKEMFEKGELGEFLKKKNILQMRQYIYKTLIAVLALVLVFEFTIGKTINKFDKKIEALFSKEGRKNTIISIKEEMQKAIDKENYLSSDERVLINDFINKIRRELEIKKQLNFLK